MCRIFGFRSVIDSQVHSSLVSAENALMNQSSFHADGWGVAYYLASTPHVVKSEQSAIEDSLFKKVSGVVSAKTVLAHIRKSTIGAKNAVNTHPFQHAKWTFGHNGNIREFDKHRGELLNLVDPCLQKYILGSTDSELFFYILLSYIHQMTSIYEDSQSLRLIEEGVEKAIENIVAIVGNPNADDAAEPTETFLTFVLTDGSYMIGFQGGKQLYYSTYKTLCPDRDSCAKFASICEAAAQPNTPINHLIFSSEPLHGENIWLPLSFGEMYSIGPKMILNSRSIF